VDLDLAGLVPFGADVRGEVAHAVGPLAGGLGIGRAVVLVLEGNDALATLTLFNNGFHDDALVSQTLVGLDGAFQGNDTFFLGHVVPSS